ncbi:YcjF family protein [Synechococcus sp. CCY9201]|uniref:YcjF family protein n=1 Tax=Synechococcus sp. CCY9201 TaxID=174697 RepID=UPI002B21B0EF|nr:YcjF family protein [Synechococcus sp. CCY9201]MEA5473854.1 YcjF family protein [Synechococcus sp. CCY9201]
MTSPDHPSPAAPGAATDSAATEPATDPSALGPAVRRLLRRGPWLPVVVVAGSGWLVSDLLGHVGHGLMAAALPAAAAAAGLVWLSGRGTVTARLPATASGLLQRCEGLMEQFVQLEGAEGSRQQERRRELQEWRSSQEEPGLSLALVGVQLPEATAMTPMRDALRGRAALALHWARPLPASSPDWRWPTLFERCDVLLYHLRLPLSAADLRWLEGLDDCPCLWLLATFHGSVQDGSAQRMRQELAAQLPAGQAARVLFWDGSSETLAAALEPLALDLRQRPLQLRRDARLRSLRLLHRRWQADLEQLRRQRWIQLQQRTQWIVAAGVFAAPVPSLDLLVLAVANGLMLQEMARLWGCSWSMAQLRDAALELGKAALAQGVVEWSTQALAAAIKLHGATWLIGGTVQAVSAAYLTRVVGHAMADMLALTAGVAAPDLERIKRQAPLLVARAAEAEKLDWAAFLQQGRNWVQEQSNRINGAVPALPQAST